eukprot:JP435663.1.p1 GENE.JP435663.1~~JP435663.1.p1  ORF type:complete len:665 (-),score=142.61 JP435663.1:302-2296(-)
MFVFEYRHVRIIAAYLPYSCSPMHREIEEALQVSESFGTISEYFFLTIRALHIGPMRTIAHYTDINKQMYDVKKKEDELESQRGTWGAMPAHIRAQYEKQLQDIKDFRDKLLRNRVALDVQLMDEAFLLLMLRFSRLQAVFLMRTMRFDGATLPLSVPVPRAFASLPEHFVESIADLLVFLCHFQPNVFTRLTTTDMDDLLLFMLICVGSPVYFTNPYLRAKFTEVISLLVPSKTPGYRSVGDGFASLFITNKVVVKYLAPFIMKFYVDIEFTGSHTQFYDKFKYRHYMANLLDYMWELPEYRAAIKQEAASDGFVRFVNMLINDSIFCFDEAITNLQQIRVLQIEISNTDEWNAREEKEKQEKEQELSQAENIAKYNLQQANEAINMIHYFSKELVEPFMVPALVDRIAALLNDFLLRLVGPKCVGLKVNDPERLGFRPKELLAQVSDIYVHFSGSSVFASAVAHDGRSYRPEVFQKATKILSQHALRSEESVKKFSKLARDVQNCLNNEKGQDELLGDLPDEYTDPVTAELMKDPVLLPSSKVVVDRATILRHLLSDETDPFNRSFLRIEDVIPATELKAEIDAFVKARLSGQDYTPTSSKAKPSASEDSAEEDASSESITREDSNVSVATTRTISDGTSTGNPEGNEDEDLKAAMALSMLE